MKKLIGLLICMAIVTFSLTYGYMTNQQYEMLRLNIKEHHSIPSFAKEELLK